MEQVLFDKSKKTDNKKGKRRIADVEEKMRINRVVNEIRSYKNMTSIQPMDNTYTNLSTRVDMAKMPAPIMSEFDKKVSDFFRHITPFIPNNFGNWARKKLGAPTKLGYESIDEMRRAALYKSVENAIKRSGKLKGGTEYEDYETTPGYKNQIMKAKAGEINPFIGIALGLKDAAYDMATTFGRVSYEKNPDGTVTISDIYDFKNNYTQDKSGKLKKDYMKDKSDLYSNERKRLAEEAQNEVVSDRSKSNFSLSPKDTIGYANYLKNKKDIALPSQNSFFLFKKKKK